MIEAGPDASARGRVPPLAWVGLILLAELALLHLASHQRYVGLTRADNAALLIALHQFSKVLAVGMVLVLALAAWRRELHRPALAGRGLRAALAGLHGALFLALLGLYQVLPPWQEIDRTLSPAELAVFAAKIAAFLGVLASGFALAMPAAFGPYARSPAALAVCAAILAVVTAVAGANWLTVAAIRRPIEDATLALSLMFYDLTGMPPPQLSFDGTDPVMAAGGFAIIISPICSGYQGVFSAAAILGGYVVLERRALRLGRAAAVVLAAMVAVFVLNAARIALLFAIGVGGEPEVAVNGFHSNFGVLSLLSVVVLAVLVLETAPLRLEGGGRLPALSVPPEELERLGRLGLPLAGMMAASILVGLGVGTVNWLYPVSAAVGAVLLWAVRDDLRAALAPGPSVAGYACGVLVYGLWVLLVPPDPGVSAAFAAVLLAAPVPVVAAWIVVRVIGASVIVPLAEELAFRGGLMRLITLLLPAEWNRLAVAALAVLGSSVAFGLLHSEILAGIVAGLFYGALAAWRGTLADAILAHAVTNFLLAVTVLGFGHWSYW